MKRMLVRLTFTDEILGTASADPEIHRRFVASKAPDAPSMEEEVEALGAEAVEGRTVTVFPRDKDGRPILWDYQVRGFFKDACSMLRRVPGTKSAKLKAYRKEIDGLVFVEQREIPLVVPGMDAAKAVGECQRPLRGSTPQGERVALAASESLPEGTQCEFAVICMRDDLEPVVREWLDYARLRGIGQWRNAGHGRAMWEELDSEGNVIGGNASDLATKA